MRLHADSVLHYLHSHWLCSTKGSSMSSCFMKEVLISCTRSRETRHSEPQTASHSGNESSGAPPCSRWGFSAGVRPYLHGECVCERGNTLQGLVRATAATAPHRHAGRDEEVVGLPRQLLPHLHQGVPGLAAAPGVNLQPAPHWNTHTGRAMLSVDSDHGSTLDHSQS